ncbi:MAG: hypothetical protein AABZ32_11210, partial [Bacteroidota bacterium]
MAKSRVPTDDSGFDNYIRTTTNHLSAVSPGSTGTVIESGIPEATTQNVAEGPFIDALEVKLENTGAASTLTFCRAGNATVGCAPPNIPLSPGASIIIALGDIPGTGNFLNVTNQFGLGAGSYRVTLPIANFVRLGISGAEYVAWVGFYNQWIAVYALYVNEGTRNKTITNQKNNIKHDFTAFTEALLTRMSGSATIMEEDRLPLNLLKRDRVLTLRGEISTAPDVALTPLEGGKIRQRLRVDTDSSKASIHPLADGWKRYMKIGA